MKKDLAHHQAPLQSLYQALLTLETPAEVEAFLYDLCTPTEVAAFADRWHAANLLSLGKSQRDVAFQTGIALATVTRVARFLTSGAGGYKAVMKKLATKPAA
jgi:TrpR-related protein YerC/YecD